MGISHFVASAVDRLFSLLRYFMSTYPELTLSANGMVVRVFPPDAESGFYRSSRFDWSGMIASVVFNGHTYFGEWRTPHDPKNTEHGIGLCEEFGLENDPPLWKEAAIGDTFVKIGVGVLQKTTEAYAFSEPYPIVELPPWKVTVAGNSVTFQQELSHKGVGYEYTKCLEISQENEGELLLKHSLRNTGDVDIKTLHYNHAFTRIDDQPTGPDYQEPVERDTPLWTPLKGWESAEVSSFAVVNQKLGAGMRFSTDRKPVSFNFFAADTAVCPEPFVEVALASGEAMSWTTSAVFGDPSVVAAF
eukprot:NODE_2808_length_1116_cov_30.491097_g2577_i0.p1 GENE.NODE_2808_length_1116_cov_30.491097_g2577_i0~~NODE_2808_length_1116_cov_30.491097_g2577_i0.p1  ORF type:complete len:303 (+),score=41.89 NODE_2808_length_1116_cov_30.491097_g2577_i0:29-937(+)